MTLGHAQGVARANVEAARGRQTLGIAGGLCGGELLLGPLRGVRACLQGSCRLLDLAFGRGPFVRQPVEEGDELERGATEVLARGVELVDLRRLGRDLLVRPLEIREDLESPVAHQDGVTR